MTYPKYDINAQQRAFVEHYCVHFNATKAAVDSGYSSKSAMSLGCQLLKNPKVQAAIEARLEDYGKKNEVLKARILNQLCNLAFSNISDYLSFNDKGMTTRDSAELTWDQSAAILKVKEHRTVNSFGENWNFSFELHDKVKPLELLGKHIGMFKDTVEVPPGGTDLDKKDAKSVPLTFAEFCNRAGYPKPYPKQIEMVDFVLHGSGARLFLGSRGYGKTDYCPVLGVAYEIFLNPLSEENRYMIVTKSHDRNTAILAEIAGALEKNGLTAFDKRNSQVIRVAGLVGKDNSVIAKTIRSSGFRGWHPKLIIMDDPVTPEDTSQAERNRVQKLYNELHKLCPNIAIIGQPVHKYDLYETLRPKMREQMKLLEMPIGTIPELDPDLEAQRLAGVEESSIQSSYFLKVPSVGATPFDNVKYIKEFPKGDAVAWIDPSHKGGDYTALSIVRAYMQGVAAVGFCWKMAWNHSVDELVPMLIKYGVKKLAIECNALGDMPVELLRSIPAIKQAGIGVVGLNSTGNKHSFIMAAGQFAHLIHLSKESHQIWTDQVVKYEYKAEFDDAPDSLASCMNWLGLIRGKR